MGLFGGGKKQGASPMRRRVRPEPERKAGARRDVLRAEPRR
jgi:hypothetical protein